VKDATVVPKDEEAPKNHHCHSSESNKDLDYDDTTAPHSWSLAYRCDIYLMKVIIKSSIRVYKPTTKYERHTTLCTHHIFEASQAI
jgi:hypothetical protein